MPRPRGFSFKNNTKATTSLAQAQAPTATVIANVSSAPAPSIVTSLANEAANAFVSGAAMHVGARVVDAVVGPRSVEVVHTEAKRTSPCGEAARALKACETTHSSDSEYECRVQLESLYACHRRYGL